MAPGVVVHELGHLLLCRLSGVPVRQVVLFRIGSPAGFVSHAAPRLLRQHFAIASGPLVVSSLLSGALFMLVARLGLQRPWAWWPILAALGVWLAWSIALEAWPSAGDAHALRRSADVHLRRFDLAALPALFLAWILLAVTSSRRLGGHWLYAALLAGVAARLVGW